MLNEAVLKAACIKANDAELDAFADNIFTIPDVVLKKKDRIEINKYLKILDDGYKKGKELSLKTVRKKYNSKKALKNILIAAIILALLVVTSVAVKPVRNFFSEITSDGTFFKFSSSNDDDYLYAKYNYIPEGYTLESDEKMSNMQVLEYRKGDLVINIDSAINKGTSMFVNSEGATETGEVMVGSSVGYYCINKNETSLVWATGRYNYMIMADNCDEISVDTLVKIALSREKLS